MIIGEVVYLDSNNKLYKYIFGGEKSLLQENIMNIVKYSDNRLFYYDANNNLCVYSFDLWSGSLIWSDMSKVIIFDNNNILYLDSTNGLHHFDLNNMQEVYYCTDVEKANFIDGYLFYTKSNGNLFLNLNGEEYQVPNEAQNVLLYQRSLYYIDSNGDLKNKNEVKVVDKVKLYNSNAIISSAVLVTDGENNLYVVKDSGVIPVGINSNAFFELGRGNWLAWVGQYLYQIDSNGNYSINRSNVYAMTVDGYVCMVYDEPMDGTWSYTYLNNGSTSWQFYGRRAGSWTNYRSTVYEPKGDVDEIISILNSGNASVNFRRNKSLL